MQKQSFNFIISDSLIFFYFYNTYWHNRLQMSLAYNHLPQRSCHWQYCGALALCGAPGNPGALSAPENTVGALVSMVIGAHVSGGKLGPGTSRGAATLVLCTRERGTECGATRWGRHAR